MNLRRICRSGITAGLISGAILAILSFLVVEPLVDQALVYEEKGHDIIDRSLQRAVGSATWALWGVIVACFFGAGYSLLASRLPGRDPMQKSLYLAAIVFLVTVGIPQLKYPAWPPGVESQMPLMLRQLMRLIILVGGGAIVASAHILYGLASRSIRARNMGLAIGTVVIGVTAVLLLVYYMPVDNAITVLPESLLMNFRVASVVSQLVFWILLGVLFGNFWNRRV